MVLDFIPEDSTPQNFADEAVREMRGRIFFFTSGGNLFIILGK